MLEQDQLTQVETKTYLRAQSLIISVYQNNNHSKHKNKYVLLLTRANSIYKKSTMRSNLPSVKYTSGENKNRHPLCLQLTSSLCI